ncbi:MAG TPA: toprim domain-containing protein [Chitinophagaceae bacterium]|nr:toprim domain-containing protein [Chitinophagaceae bacterium]
MENNKFNCIEANSIDLVDYLSNLGYHPQKTNGNNYWYFSPLRDENTPSFKVNRKLNVWFDFGEGKGGTLVDFGVRYFNCSVSEFLTRIKDRSLHPFSFHPRMADEKKNSTDGKILIVNAQPLHSKQLLDYLNKIQIPLSIAERFCEEIEFSLYNKKQSAIGFKNDRGGYELRNESFKGSSSPKYVTSINTNSNHLSVFEGFFDFLSWQVFSHRKNDEPLQGLSKIQTDFLILNSLSFFEKMQKEMGKYARVNLFLDSDNSGIKATQKAIANNSILKDQSILHKDFKDLNDKLIDKRLMAKHAKGLRPHF